MKRCIAIAMGIAVVSNALTGCAGRTAAWEAKDAAKEAAAATDDSPAASHVEAGDAAWAERTDPEKIRAAIAAWTKAAEVAPADADTLTKLTRAHYFLADGYLRGDDDAYLSTMDQGVAWGEKAMMAASPDFAQRMRNGDKLEKAIEAVGVEGIGALYWYASNLGKWAKKKGFAVLLGQKDKVKAIMERCLSLDPNFFHGAPDRYFGAFYAIAPGFAGGDLNKSEEHYAASLKIAPDYLGTRVLMAENLAVKKQDKALFQEQLQTVVDADPDAIPELAAEFRVEQQKAKELLGQIDELF